MNVGQRIKARRIELEMSMEQLANKLGINRSTVYRYETGEIEKMPIGVIKPIAEALRTTPAYLMGWDQEEIDAASMQIAEKNAYYDSKESFIEEISEMVLTPEDFKRMQQYAQMMQKADLRIISDYFYKVYELQLTEEEIKDVYSYAQFIRSKRT